MFSQLSPVCPAVANRTVDQTNIVGDAAVAGANEVSQATVEGVENVAASTGLAYQVSCHGNAAPIFNPEDTASEKQFSSTSTFFY